MCFHSKQTKATIQLKNRFKATKVDLNIKPSNHFNGFSYPATPIITNTKQAEIQLFNWGLIPSWAKDKSIQKFTLNARIETLTEKPSFKKYVNNRCLIIANGFYEWKWLDNKGKQKQKYCISLPNDELFSFGGIYSEWKNAETGETINSYSIVTTVGNDLMKKIHNKNRMPVILTEKNEQAWLNGTFLSDFTKMNVDLKALKV